MTTIAALKGMACTAGIAMAFSAAVALHAAQQPAGTARGTTQIWIDADAPPRLPPVACLHGADAHPAEQRRREAALGYVRSIQTAQAAYFGRNGRYAHVSELPGRGGVPAGFVLQHAAAGNSYMFSLKDQRDPCGFTLYSDHGGTIYAAAPLGAGDQPSRK